MRELKRKKTAGLPDKDDEAAEIFVQRLHGEWTPSDQTAFERRLERDTEFADAYKRVEESWRALDVLAEAPELMSYREEAIAAARRSSAERWFKPSSVKRWRAAAAVVAIAVAAAAAWQFSPYGRMSDQYRTAIGEHRIIELADRSRIMLDAATRVRVRYSDDVRVIELLEGQAQFAVAKDPVRPFKVLAGDHAIVALGTVFTVEYVDRKIHVAMLEGKVAIVPGLLAVEGGDARTVPETAQAGESSSRGQASNEPADTGQDSARIIELTAGEELRVSFEGRATVTPDADLEAATAWRDGKVIFRAIPLGEAVQRMNRYSHMKLEVDDPSLANKHISGVFEAGDVPGFVNALQRYLPLTAEYSGSDTIRLKAR